VYFYFTKFMPYSYVNREWNKALATPGSYLRRFNDYLFPADTDADRAEERRIMKKYNDKFGKLFLFQHSK